MSLAADSGTGSSLAYCGYIGGSGTDYGIDIAVDSAGDAYVTGNTQSTEATFPVTDGPDMTSNGGGWDAFVARINASGTALDYCGFIGGSAFDSGVGIAVDSAGNAFVAGTTSSNEASFPVTVGPDLASNGMRDTFVAKISRCPTIVTQPQSQSVAAGGSATLSVGATGDEPLSYQWYQGASGNTATPQAGAASASFTTPPVSVITDYWVRVSNSCGDADSATATISIGGGGCTAPAIATQPASQTVASDGTATLTVSATGSEPFTYQWYQGAAGDLTQPVAGAVSDTLATPALYATTSYWARVSNSCGSADSDAAVITVSGGSGPIITLIKSKTRKPGSKATIVGSGFSTTKTKNTVLFGSRKATVTKAKATKLTVTIPTRNLHAGQTVNVTVTVNGAVSNPVSFQVK